ncbi:PP0621 family protein [Herminiimonas glaciei]|uniref:PP0621 family protein n=1 Tax=Herminiimonas glaciei TaxID=523788 RepID=A0ABW2IEX0_9BURK
MKFLLWAGVIVAVIWMLRSKKANKAEAPKAKASAASTREIEAMLSCAHCGTHFPASEAVRDGSDRVFCSDEHRRQHVAH